MRSASVQSSAANIDIFDQSLRNGHEATTYDSATVLRSTNAWLALHAPANSLTTFCVRGGQDTGAINQSINQPINQF